jgi:hypothetical protein
VAWLLVALSAAATTSCLLRREAGDEALTGAGMAVMAAPLSVFDPRPWGAPVLTAVLTAVFAPAALRALLLVRRRPGHHLHHSVCSAAMVYMALAMARAGPAHSGHTAPASTGLPLLTGLLLLYFAVYMLRTGTALVTVPARGPLMSGAGTVRLRHAPEVAAACRVSMAVGMFAMLLSL